MPAPSNPPGKPSGDRPHLKFNQDVLPEFKRKQDSWEAGIHGGGGHSEARKLAGETDSILKWVGAIILLLGIAAAIGLYLKKDRGAGPDPDGAAGSAGREFDREREQIKEALAGYMGAADLDTKLQYVRRRGMVEPLMREYYAQHDLYPTNIWNFVSVEPLSIQGLPFWYAVLETPEGKEVVQVQKQRGGEFKIDWETHIAFNPMTPDQYLKLRPTEKMDFRVYASADNYYNEPFADPDRYFSVKLEFSKSAVGLFGYVERTSPDFTSIFELIKEETRVPLLLALEWPADDGTSNTRDRLPQVKISELVSSEWIVIDER